MVCWRHAHAMAEAPTEYAFPELAPGMEASFSRTVSADDVANFAALSGDKNPLHLDAAYAETTSFKRPIVHGALLASLFSELIGMHLPGRRSLYLSQTLLFKKPAFVGDTVEVQGTIRSMSAATQSVEIDTRIFSREECLVEGLARVRIL